MKKLLTAMTAVSALMAAAPAAAQTGYQQPYNNGYNTNYNANANGAVGIENRLARIEARIQAGLQSGAIDQREARNLRWQLRQLSRLDRQYGRNGYTQAERADMQQRLRTFREQLRMADGGGNGYGPYADTNNNYGQGGPYEEAYCDSRNDRGGIAGLFDSIFGGGTSASDSCYGLQVGQRVTGNLGAVPYEYRNQYRDGSGYYHRSDGRTIYRIDARTQTVIGVYPIR